MLALVAGSLAALAAVSLLLARRMRALLGGLDALAERVQELSARLDAAEEDASRAHARAEAAETVLVDKGLADEEDLEAARRRFDDPSGPDVRGDGELH